MDPGKRSTFEGGADLIAYKQVGGQYQVLFVDNKAIRKGSDWLEWDGQLGKWVVKQDKLQGFITFSGWEGKARELIDKLPDAGLRAALTSALNEGRILKYVTNARGSGVQGVCAAARAAGITFTDEVYAYSVNHLKWNPAFDEAKSFLTECTSLGRRAKGSGIRGGVAGKVAGRGLLAVQIAMYCVEGQRRLEANGGDMDDALNYVEARIVNDLTWHDEREWLYQKVYRWFDRTIRSGTWWKMVDELNDPDE